MKRPIVYLAGRICGLPYKVATGWREELVQTFDYKFQFINPMEGCQALNIKKRIIHVNDNPTGEDIFVRSMQGVIHSDIVVANLLDGVVFGTPVEVGVAWAMGKEIYIIHRASEPYHPFYDAARRTFYTLKQLNQFLAEYNVENLRRIPSLVETTPSIE